MRQEHRDGKAYHKVKCKSNQNASATPAGGIVIGMGNGGKKGFRYGNMWQPQEAANTASVFPKKVLSTLS